MVQTTLTENFVRLTTVHQRRVYSYILAQLPNRADADEVLQETNVILWQKFDQFEPGTDFRAWACRIAYFEVLRFRKRRGRDVPCFSDVFIADVAEAALERADELDARQRALATCISKLPARDFDLVRRRYAAGASAREVAAQVGRSVDAVYKAIRRIRRALSECITRAVAREGCR